MKIRMIESGYESFSGYFGTVEFKDGVSVGNVSDVEARFFASVISVECVEDGKDPGANAQFQAALKMEATSTDLPTLAELRASGKIADEVKVEARAVAQGTYTAEQLEQIADKKGIAGLREISDPLGIKGTSIAKLIEAIMEKQIGPQPEAAPLAEGQPDVVTSEQAE